MINSSLTILIPAYNEEPTLGEVVVKVAQIAEKYVVDYEIIIVNDASLDNTGKIADDLAMKNSHIRVVHNPTNMNLGYNMRKGMEMARMEYFCMFPADGDVTEETFERMIIALGKADFVLAYHSNYKARHPLRRVVSKLFTGILNFLFRLHVRYYNGPVIFKTDLLRSVAPKTFGFAFTAETVIRLIKRGHSFVEIPMVLRPERKGANLRVFRPRNLWSVIKTILTLWWRVEVKREF